LPSLSASNTTDWAVLPILDCQNSTFIGVGLRDGMQDGKLALTDLIMNSDSVLFQSHIVDLFGDPLENKTTTISIQEETKKVKRGPGGGVIYSDANGNANLTSQDQGIYPVTWVGQFETCSDTHDLEVK